MNKDDYVPNCSDDPDCECMICEDFHKLVNIIDYIIDPEDKEFLQKLFKHRYKAHKELREIYNITRGAMGWKKRKLRAIKDDDNA